MAAQPICRCSTTSCPMLRECARSNTPPSLLVNREPQGSYPAPEIDMTSFCADSRYGLFLGQPDAN